MTKYFHVTEGIIDEGPRVLPMAWRNISGLHLLDDAALKPLGWLPQEVVGSEPFDPVTQTRAGPVNEAQEGKVVSTYTVASKSLVVVKADHKVKLRAAFDARGNALVASYAPTERLTWPEQATAALAYQADPQGDHPYLVSMLREGETVADLATLILTNRAAFLSASAALVKNRRALEAAIDAAETNAEVVAIDFTQGWPF